MIQFPKPTNLDGAQLVNELATAGVIVIGFPIIDGDGNLWLDIASKDEAKAKPIVAAHVATPAPAPTTAQKLESVGLTISDLKVALGLTP